MAVISDTHLSRTSSWFEDVYEKYLSNADVLIHCGDMTGVSLWRYLNRHRNFYAVRGNCDWEQELSRLPQSVSLEVDGLRIAAVHGWGGRPGVPQRVAEAYGPDHDLVCYGHTHARNWTVLNGMRLLNPGSLCEQGSLALLDLIDGQEPECSFVDF